VQYVFLWASGAPNSRATPAAHTLATPLCRCMHRKGTSEITPFDVLYHPIWNVCAVLYAAVVATFLFSNRVQRHNHFELF